MKNAVFFACLAGFALLAASVPAQETAGAAPSSAFDCSKLYDDGEYAEAAACFEILEWSGNHNGHLLYNIGNARFRSGEFGRALLAYRRAQLFLPRDADLTYNLEEVRKLIKDDLPPPDSREPLAQALLAPYDALSASELLLLGAGAWALLMLLLSVRLSRPFAGWAPAVVAAGAVAAAALIGSGVRSYQVKKHPIAVVLAEEVTLRSRQDVQSSVLARLHEGAEGSVVEEAGEWVQIEVVLDNATQGWLPTRGWLPSDSVGLVRPASHRGPR